jgi:DNA-binding transcriptional LysR family regulator
MELYQIRYFLAAADTLNFTKAAERCFVTQPTLTRAIKKLEDDLGGTLFHRERSHMQLTELGREMRTRFTFISQQTHEAQKAARQLLNLEKATLNIGVMCTIGPARVMGVLASFQRDNPGVEINLHETSPDGMTDGLLNGALDASLLGLPTPLHERFDSLHLYSERMVVIFEPGHRFVKMRRVPISAFDGEAYLDRLNCEFRSIWFDLLEERGVEIEVAYRSAREDWIQSMVRVGLGVCLVPEHSISVEGLQSRPTRNPDIQRTVELVTVAGRRRSAALSAFMETAKSRSWSA